MLAGLTYTKGDAHDYYRSLPVVSDNPRSANAALAGHINTASPSAERKALPSPCCRYPINFP